MAQMRSIVRSLGPKALKYESLEPWGKGFKSSAFKFRGFRCSGVASPSSVGSSDLSSFPKGPSSPYLWLWFCVPIKAPKSLNNEDLDP